MNWLRNKILKHINGEKDKQIAINMLGAFGIKGGALFISLFTMPAYIRYFDNQIVLGLWFTILSVMSWILSFDFGIGNGLRNKLVCSMVKEDKQEVKAYISSAYVIIGGIVLLATFFGFVVSGFIDWNIVFNISKDIIPEETMLFAVRCVFFGVILQFLLRLISSILYAMQRSALTNLISLITSILQLTFVLLSPSYNIETNLKMLALIFVACVNIPLIVATIIVFRTELKNCAPSFRFFEKSKAMSILSLGGVFFWNQIMYMIIVTTNEFLISHFSGPEFVVEYQIYNKLFTVVGSLFMLALSPIWSAITKAFNEKDVVWLNKTYRLLNYMVLFAVFCEFLIIIFLQMVINIWLGGNAITVNYIFAIVFALFGSIFIYQSVLSTMVCGMGKMKLQAICYTIGVILKFSIISFGIKIFDSWIIVIIANSIILLPYCILQPRYIKKDIVYLKIGGVENV